MIVLNCKHCMREMQVDDSSIGELAQCPMCQNIVAVSDPLPAIGSELDGYKIESVTSSTLAVNMYQATSVSSPLPPSTRVFLQIPSTFFLKRVADFNAYSTAVIKSGSMNILGAPRILNYSLVPGKSYFAFDFFESTTLASFISTTGPTATSNAMRIMRICAGILSNAWNQHGIIHQNITPSNIRINALQNITFMNIGVSQVLHMDKKLLEQGFNIWDQHYMSPELAMSGHGLSPSCDIYALGMVLFFLLTGKTPHEKLSQQSIHDAPPPDLGIALQQGSDEIVSLYQSMTMKISDHRINNWEEVIRRIDLILSGGAAVAAPPTTNNALVNQGVATGSEPPVAAPVPAEKAVVAPPATPATVKTANAIMTGGSKTEKNRRLQKLKKKNSQKGFFENNLGLVITCLVVFLIAVPLITYIVKKNSKKSIRKRNLPTAAVANRTTTVNSAVTSSNIVLGKDKTPLKTYTTTSRKKDVTTLGEKSKLNETTSEKTTKKQTLRQKIRDVGEYLKKNPNDVEIVLKRYEAIIDEARTSKRLDIIDLVQNITADISDPKPPIATSTPPDVNEKSTATEKNPKENPITAAVMNDIRRKVDKLLRNKDYNNAIWFVKEYAGAYSDETQAQRKVLLKEINKKREDDPESVAAPESEKISSTDEADDETDTKKSEGNAFLEKMATILEKYSLNLNPESPQKLFIQLMKTRITRSKAKKLAMELKDLTDQGEKKDFTQNNVDLIDALRLFCKRNAGGSLKIKIHTSPPKTVSSYENLTDFLNSINTGDRVRLNPGTFSMGSAEIAKDNVTIIGKNAVIEGGRLSITGDKCSISGLSFTKVKIRTFKSNDTSMDDCVLNESNLTLTKSNNFLATNTFFTSVTLNKSKGFKANHCTFASLDDETPALKVEADDFLISNSILYSKGYAIVFMKKQSNKKFRLFNSMLYGEKAFCVRETESGDYRKSDMATKKSKVKLFIKTKNNIYTDPQFEDPWKPNWRLEEGKPGTEAASDKKDCGVIWPCPPSP